MNKVISVGAGIGAGVTAWMFSSAHLLDAQIYSVATAIAALSGTALGFLVTALSIFAALYTRDLVQRLQRTGHYEQVINKMFLSAALFMGSAIAGVFCLFASDSAAQVVLGVDVGLVTTALAFLLVSGYQFYLVLKGVR